QWKDKWKEYFHPTKITDRLVVKPSWEDYSPAAGDLVIEIDPGMAFGTGTHETTSLCMKLLEKYMGASAADKDKKSEDVKGSAEGWGLKVLDVGCGSGILSIAAARLGAGDVLGVEIDEDAVLVARENVELNGCSEGVKVIQGDLTKGIDYKADIIVANLMADLVMMLAGSAKAHLAPGGIFISSGILTDKEEIVSSAIVEAGFEIVEVAEDGEWCAIAARG
ncbi:MAG: 50S ribosomal protein L11 methyltransferase, partial [Firmicutes bacterium]|nr:50S ribosomal protein L11 methyltransferase [Bacillota bacterium]